MTTVIAVPTAITGFFGQNVPYPGFQSAAGFAASSALTVVLMIRLYVAFRPARLALAPLFLPIVLTG
ncbi:MAG: magnesium transporter [Mycobacterium sp.]|jgi:Mg2+ and Co2+ transporter CorA|nr:magnesium transporter [Mycobacterium sp.]